MLRKTTEEFIKQAKDAHGDKYDYSLSVYAGCYEDVKVICPIHGLFLIPAAQHTSSKKGCQLCGKERQIKSQTSNIEEFVQKAKKVHGDRYDYSKTEYLTARKAIEIVCPKHGSFWQTPDNHLRGQGCRKCRNEAFTKKFPISTDEFIQRARKTHGDRYDYSLVEYKNNKTKVEIVCPKHGSFWQTPGNHFTSGCPNCKSPKVRKW